MGKKQGQDTPITLPPLYRQERVWGTLFPAHYKRNDVINSVKSYTSGTEHVQIGYLSY